MGLALPLLIGLGIWQLQRMHWKEGLLADMAAAAGRPLLEAGDGAIPPDAAFRQVRVAVNCPPQEPLGEAGRNVQGMSGWAFALDCTAGGGQKVQWVIGWAERPDGWRQADVPAGETRIEGLAAPGARAAWRITPSAALPPLLPVAPPSPADIPNNHFAYAIQWFAFAGVLLLIYGLLVRRWLASPGGNE